MRRIRQVSTHPTIHPDRLLRIRRHPGKRKKMPSENLSDGIFAGKSVKDFASA
ncbi:FIG00848752: hypothetical protein [Neisseria meningitidis serogroup B]|uniref:Uncharacterized protein n=3 Tax=Neisseria meningitidis TaxID=487 RepID=A0A0H5QSF1_NEIMI|nr:hypothetical protein predicted by Glimmer/Critica [Neisseria meningitidis alpha275]CCA45691.1 hypothetical protein NMALPHA522_2150 [Neisseria meningitidis alpha522]CRY98562.1 FIG00848752: hypothetical protein [Neisseria meningitidis serogroup B]